MPEINAFFDLLISTVPQTISIIGLAKNVGKTTTLNYLIERASFNANIKIGISSTGWDGETYDSITGKPKPKIILHKGTIAATTEECLTRSSSDYRTIEKTNLPTSLGNVVIIEVLDTGRFEIAGPVTISELDEIKKKLILLGANLILFDGAINRKASSSKLISDRIIIASGMNAGYNTNEVKINTNLILSVYSLPVLPIQLEIVADYGKIYVKCNTEFIKLDRESDLNSLFSDDMHLPSLIYIPGAFTDKTAEKIITLKKKIDILIDDPSSFFLTPQIWGKLNKQKKKIFLREKAEIACITLNPVSSSGYAVKSDSFLETMRDICKNFNTWDVVSGLGL